MSVKDIIRQIVESAGTYTHPEGQTCRVISLNAVTSIATAEKISVRDAEITALKNGIVPWRYVRNLGTIGLDGQIKLLESTVAVVGCGGLGGTIVELLARQGTGHMIIIDGDRFTEQNLNRQTMSTENDLGKYKADTAAKRVRAVNKAVSVTTFIERLNEDNGGELLSGASVAADALDNLPSRFALEKACRDLGIPLVHGTIGGFYGQVMTIFPEDAGFRSIYGSLRKSSTQGIEVKTGNPSATPAVVAGWQVQEIVKIITGIGSPIRNSLLLLDMIEGTAERIEVRK